jgi:hypothetical protein
MVAAAAEPVRPILNPAAKALRRVKHHEVSQSSSNPFLDTDPPGRSSERLRQEPAEYEGPRMGK